jgi:hypothetical protein
VFDLLALPALPCERKQVWSAIQRFEASLGAKWLDAICAPPTLAAQFEHIRVHAARTNTAYCADLLK